MSMVTRLRYVWMARAHDTGGWCVLAAVGEDAGMSPRRPPADRTDVGSYPTAELPTVARLPTAVFPMAGHPTAAFPMAGHPTAALPMAGHPTAALPMAGHPKAALPTAAEWKRLERGVAQRVWAFEAFLADVYDSTDDARVLADGVLPRRLVTASERFRREAVGVAQPVRVVIASVDVVRDEHGAFRVVADDLSCPAWPAYVAPHLLRALRAVTRAATHDADLASSATAPSRANAGATGSRAAASHATDSVVVALAPGESALARQPGVTAVAARDLVCRNNVVYHRDRRVDVLYRAIADDLLDPLHFQPDSVHGVSGVLNAARTGSVVVANAVGNGLGEDPVIHSFVPQFIEYYLGESPILPTVDPQSFHTTQLLPITGHAQGFSDLPAGLSTVDNSPFGGLRLFAVNDGVDVTVLSDSASTSELSTSNIPQQSSTVDTTVLW
ncbi:MAG: hypothetical protein GEU97_18525 [Actinophytocola sp.]|nr:hypothetical protein [Actinophytocola sp.]